VDEQRLVIGRDDRDEMRSGDEVQVLVIAAEGADHADIRTIDVHLRAPRFDIELDATGRSAFRWRDQYRRDGL